MMKHIPIVIGREDGKKAVARRWLCGRIPVGMSFGEPCDVCYLLHGVLEANVRPWWLQSRPFLAALDLTRGARWFALSVLRSVPTDEVESELFSRWVAARTFERLKELIKSVPFVHQPPGPMPTIDDALIGCHFCGARPLTPAQTLSGKMVCPVCASRDITWPRS